MDCVFCAFYCWSSPALVEHSVMVLNGTRVRVCETGSLHLLRSSEWDVGELCLHLLWSSEWNVGELCQLVSSDPLYW